MSKEKEYTVLIPDEEYQIINFEIDNLPAVAVVNLSLIEFEPKKAFSWRCSIIINFKNLIENGMPSNNEVTKAIKFEEYLDLNIKGENQDKPNALFLARITWDGTRQFIWRVFDPESTNDFLNKIIEKDNNPFEIDFLIENDKKWKLDKWYLKNAK